MISKIAAGHISDRSLRAVEMSIADEKQGSKFTL
jgi:hypothetical protein